MLQCLEQGFLLAYCFNFNWRWFPPINRTDYNNVTKYSCKIVNLFPQVATEGDLYTDVV